MSRQRTTISNIVGRYNLDELIWGEGLFFQDSYRIRPNLTLNYGLRVDFTAADKDLSKLYHSASPAAIFGPSGVNNLFNPGVLTSDPEWSESDAHAEPQPLQCMERGAATGSWLCLEPQRR